MIGKTIGNLVSPATNKSMASNIQNIHDAIGSQASQGFQDVSKGVARSWPHTGSYATICHG